VASDPPDGAGVGCDGADPDCGVPTDVSVTLSFNRFLRPDTAIRQSIAFYTGSPSNPAPPISATRPEVTPRYDVMERSVRFVLPPGFTLQPHALYTVELPIADSDGAFGFRAFDGAPLAGKTSVRISFFTGSGPSAPPARAVPSCADFVELLSGCVAPSCHGDGDGGPALGLSFDGVDALRATAVGQPAHEAETGDTTGLAEQNPERFGVNMPIIDPGRPDNSYLMYKLLIGTAPYELAPGAACPAGERCEAPEPAEIARLRTWFVRGEPMPYLGEAEQFVHHDELRAIQTFIAEGDACANGQ
jgi:hypothetical protein